MSRRSKKILLWTGAALSVPLLLVLFLLRWAGSQGSLARTLQLAQRWLPADQHLAATQVQGSLTGGGQIKQLQWSKTGTSIVVDDIRLEWSLRQLLSRDLRIRVLSATRMHVRTTPQPDKADQPFIMPKVVTLPIRITVPVAVQRIELESVDETNTSRVLVLADIVAGYRYDGRLHQLRLSSLRYGQSQAQGSVQLDGRTLALAAQAQATLRDLVADTPFAMQAQLAIRGSLADGDAARLEMTLDAQQLDADPDIAALLSAKGALHPWRKQPAQQVDLQMSHLNAHAFVATAPVTSLRGRVRLEPQAGTATWSATIDLGNDQPEAWNRQRLPVRQLSAQAVLSLEQLDIATASFELGGQARAGVVRMQGQVPLRELLRSRLQVDLQQVDLRPLMTTLPRTSLNGQVTVEPFQQGRRIRVDLRNAAPGPLDVDRLPVGRLLADARQDAAQWRIETFDVQVGSGRASLSADFAPSTRQIELKAQLQGLPLRQIHSKMALEATTRVSGTLAASGTPQQGIAFQADVNSDAPGSRPAARSQWEIRALETSGKWSPTRLLLDRVHLDAFQATVDGRDIDVSLPRLDSVKANISGAAPGAKLVADAAMSAQTGSGKVSLQLTSAEQLVSWMHGLPRIGSQLPDLRARGAAHLDMEWQGTWRQWVAGFANPASQPRLRMNAVAHSEGLAVNLPATAGSIGIAPGCAQARPQRPGQPDGRGPRDRIRCVGQRHAHPA